KAKPQERPDMRKYAEIGKADINTGTVTLGGVSTDASDAGKNSKAKPQERPDMRKYSSMGKFGKPSTATITLGASGKSDQSAGKKAKPQASTQGGVTAADRFELQQGGASSTSSGDLGDTCQIIDVLEDSAVAADSYTARATNVRTQASASASISRNATDPAQMTTLEGELQASLAEQITVLGLSAAASRVSVGASREVPQGHCGTVTSRSAGARVELGGTTVQIVRERGDASMQESVERVILRERVLLNAGPVAILVAPLLSTRADLSIEAGSLGREGHLGMRGFLQLNSSGIVATKVLGGDSSKDAGEVAELELETARNLVEVNEQDAAAEGTIRLEVGSESREDRLGAL
ncbi:MAG: hypothetical protein MK291_10210, partial [Planctomycetes bacterium]|nr:hypothetical protein [Planctomycetota bacterium]